MQFSTCKDIYSDLLIGDKALNNASTLNNILDKSITTLLNAQLSAKFKNIGKKKLKNNYLVAVGVL